MRFTKTIDIWQLTSEERAQLQPGQWVKSGPHGSLGRFYGEGRASTVVAWTGNARGHRNQPGGIAGYHKFMRQYAKSCGAR